MAELTTNTSGGASTPGQRLRQAREAKGLSLEQVSRSTKIHLNVLTAIEADRAQTISPIYLKGFLKTYARHLGEDEAALLALLSTGPTGSAPARASTPLPRHTAAAKRPAAAETTRRLANGLSRVPWRVVGTAVGVVLALWFGARWVRAHGHRPAPATARVASMPAPFKKLPAKKVAAAPATAKAAKKKPTAHKAAAAGPAVSDGVHLTVQAQSLTWVQVMADGAVIFQQVLQPGARETWLAKQEITLWLGDAGGVSLELNGRPLGVPGKRGEVLRGLRITPNGMQR